MKTSFLFKISRVLLFACVLSAPSNSFAETVTNDFTFVTSLTISDNDFVGVADTRTINSPIESLTEIRVTLDISGGYNGDLYAYLRHDSGFSILLNRTGKSATDIFGSPDSGFNVTFEGGASNGDIHTYEMSFDPNGGVLTGIWQPDGRNVHPNDVLSTDSRTADFGSFVGVNPNGNWTLFVADISPAGVSHLNGWGVEQVGVVPEPGTFALVSVGLALVVGKMRRRNGNK
jgi:subtilisin-like proprotein convertase family protein